MIDPNANTPYWNGQHTAYLCADLTEVAVRKRIFRLNKKHIANRSAYQDYMYADLGIFANRALYNPYQQAQVTVPQSGIIYKRNCQPAITVSKTLFRREAKTLILAVDRDRTYSFPDTVCIVQQNAFQSNTVLRAVRLNKKMKELSISMFSNSPVQTVICPVVPRDVISFLNRGNESRKVVLPNGVWLATSRQGLENLLVYKPKIAMVVPQNVREINYLPVYKNAGVSEVRFLPGSQLETIGDGAFAGTDIREFVSPPSLLEVGYGAFINC